MLKNVCAAYHGVTTLTDLTVNSTDLFLVAANNARKSAERLHDFEMARVVATLSIDGVMGGSLADAVMTSAGETQLTVAGTLSPDATGIYTKHGTFSGYPLFILAGSTSYFLYYNVTTTRYILAATLSSGSISNKWALAAAGTTPLGSFVAAGANTGTATITQTGASIFSGIKTVVGVNRLNNNGTSAPLDFARADIPMERVRTELELSEVSWWNTRYPSDSQYGRDIGSSGSVIQRGNSLFVYPRIAETVDALSILLEAYGWLDDYVTADLSDTEPSDFLCDHGGDWLQWSIIVELNYKFKTFVARQEGNLASPEKMRDEAWRDLLLWDSYMVDANTTRSR